MNSRLQTPASILPCAIVLLCFGLRSETAFGQAGLRESLERLDRDQNGMLDPGEITTLARPYLERITRERRLDLDRPIEIYKLQEAARIYYALANGVAGERVRPEGGGLSCHLGRMKINRSFRCLALPESGTPTPLKIWTKPTGHCDVTTGTTTISSMAEKSMK